MKRIVIGITGASGVIYGIRLLEFIKDKLETHLIITPNAKEIITFETKYSIDSVEKLANYNYENSQLNAPISSGSYETYGMIVIPCSIKSLSAIANSYSDSLLTRAADVILKEKRKLILVVRETPLHIGHMKLMIRATELGAIILPPIPAFYHKPNTIDDLINHTIGKVFDILGIDNSLFRRWEGPLK